MTAAVMIVAASMLSFSDAASDAICRKPDCGYFDAVVETLPNEEMEKVRASPAIAAKLAKRLDEGSVSTVIDAMSTIEFAALMTLLASVGIAQLRLGARRGGGLVGALPWLRRGALAALAMALLSPIFESVRAMLLLPAIDGYDGWYFHFDLTTIGVNLMLAFAALSVSWALSAGSRAQADIAEII